MCTGVLGSAVLMLMIEAQQHWQVNRHVIERLPMSGVWCPCRHDNPCRPEGLSEYK